MRKALMVAMAGLAVAISVGALVAQWEPGPRTDTAETRMQEGRDALSTDPMRPAHPAF